MNSLEVKASLGRGGGEQLEKTGKVAREMGARAQPHCQWSLLSVPRLSLTVSSSTDPCHGPSMTLPQSSLFERALLTSTNEDTNLERREENGKKSKHGVFKIGLAFLSGSSLQGQLPTPPPPPPPPHDLAGTLRGIKEQLGSWVLGLETRMFLEKPWGGKGK